MRFAFFIALAAVSYWAPIAPHAATAANISVKSLDTNPSSEKWYGGKTTLITISGDLKEGDAKRFEQRLMPFLHPRLSKSDVRGNIVVKFKNSRGGFFYEGMDIAKLIRKQDISTFVARGTFCESACAVAFLAGRRSISDMETHPERILEIGGTVGF